MERKSVRDLRPSWNDVGAAGMFPAVTGVAVFSDVISSPVFLPRLSGLTLPQQPQRLIKGGWCAKLHPRLEKW